MEFGPVLLRVYLTLTWSNFLQTHSDGKPSAKKNVLQKVYFILCFKVTTEKVIQLKMIYLPPLMIIHKMHNASSLDA